ncbi:MAG TPA: ABC transporter substrate-binding protein [Solirubrobacterales bacterium]|nr:ABC transporter substrate-binding protein [Solirubrobacterales bacterium]
MNSVRSALASALALIAAAAALSACGTEAESQADAGGPWSFTDGSGATVELDSTPQRIIAHGHAAAALMSFGIRPVGIYADGPVESDPALKGLDLGGIEILGEAWGEIDVAAAARLNPDLIVADYWPVDDAYSGMEEGVKEESKKIADLAPVVGPAQSKSVVELIEGYEELAESLGADLEEEGVLAAKQRFEDAVAAFEEAAAAKPDLTALAVSPTNDLLYVAVPEHAPELLDMRRWGLEVIVPDNPDKGFPYWENLSWENADKYQPDLLLIDDRDYAASMRAAERQPTWDSLTAADAGSTVKWPAFWLHTYDDYAEQLELLTAAVEKAESDIGA